MIGLLVALLSAVVYTVGLTVEQRALHGSESISVNRPLHLARVLLTNPRWVAGCAFAALGSVGLVVSLGLAPVSVAQPAFAAGVACGILVITLVLGERLTRGEYVALGVMPVALGLLSLSTADGTATGTTAHTPLLVIVSLATVASCLAVVGLAGGRGRYMSAAAMGIAAGFAQGSAGLQGKGLGGLLADHGLWDAVVPALLSPHPYLYAVGWAVGIVLFQTSMQRSRASITAPVANVAGNVFMVVMGTLLFGERLPDDPVMLGLRIGGFALTLVVVVLVRGNVARVEADTSRRRAQDTAPGPAGARPAQSL
ncbi:MULTISPECIES: hypothetical protein [Nocardiopsis]|uniref:Uncharacterized protein n=1 Tax=Nocardiopsis sinuspersici TaxID=501010 RepID=A0A1V3C3R1_9ACTN|nr:MULTISPECIES: hypothetical protein [Nocardiopsis]OOC55282.1 hypothetical protein NOSIN_16885 [Nocardiopsis sinuspersici]